MEPSQRLAQLAEDREHGASEITQKALPALLELASQARDPLDAVADAGAALIQAHPAMAPLVHLVDAILSKMASNVSLDAIQDALEQDRAQRADALAREGAQRVTEADVVATYSRSGTVLSALRQALEDGASFRVVISEARPGGEGVQVARGLAEAGVEVALTTDAALANRLGDADVFVTGADALCARGVVNKVGSGVLFREAARVGTRAFVLAGSDKVLPAAYRREPDLSTRQALDHALPEGVQAAAPLFEGFALSRGQRVVTEAGAWRWGEVVARVAQASVHPALLDRLA